MKVNDVVDQNLCIACGLCKAMNKDKINFQNINDKGFLYPKEIKDLDKSELIDFNTFCPGVNVEIQLSPSGKKDQLWGAIRRVGRSHSKDPALRSKASSGGVISEISKFLLENSISDEVYHLKSPIKSPFIFYPGSTKKPSSLESYAGSKYTLSPTLIYFDYILEAPQDKRFAIIGKPCEISAARKLLFSKKRGALDNFIFISFFCAGLPSLKANENLVRTLGSTPENVTQITYRGDGCPGNTIVRTENSLELKTTYKEAWGNILGRDIHPRCKVCPDGIGLDADIVCADAWDVDEYGYPSFSEHDGFSLLITRTSKADNIIDAMLKKESIHWEDFDVSKIKTIQPSQFYRRSTIIPRILAKKIFFKKTPKISGAGVINSAKHSSLKNSIKAFLGMVRRQWNQ